MQLYNSKSSGANLCRGISSAARTLTSKGIAEETHATITKLEAKHPTPLTPIPKEFFNSTETPITLEEAILEKTIRAAPRKKCPGPDGWRFEHIQLSLKEPTTFSLWVSTLRLIFKGKAPLDIHPWLSGARLVALNKTIPGGDVRPIAISSSIRRLVASAVCRQYAPDFAADFLSTLQFGVATPGGVEQLVKSLEIHLQQNPDWCVLKTDFSNVFNSVDREFAIRQLKTFYPGLFPFVASCYRGPGPLFFGSGSFAATLYSQNGIHQGDPLGPLLFSLAIEPIIAQVNGELGSNVSPTFLDDLFLVGPAAAVLEVLSNLREWGSKISLNLRIDKCQLTSNQDTTYQQFDKD